MKILRATFCILSYVSVCAFAACVSPIAVAPSNTALSSSAIVGFIIEETRSSATFAIGSSIVDNKAIEKILAAGHRVVSLKDIELRLGQFVDRNTGTSVTKLEIDSTHVSGLKGLVVIAIKSGGSVVWYECELVRERGNRWRFLSGKVIGAS